MRRQSESSFDGGDHFNHKHTLSARAPDDSMQKPTGERILGGHHTQGARVKNKGGEGHLSARHRKGVVESSHNITFSGKFTPQ